MGSFFSSGPTLPNGKAPVVACERCGPVNVCRCNGPQFVVKSVPKPAPTPEPPAPEAPDVPDVPPDPIDEQAVLTDSVRKTALACQLCGKSAEECDCTPQSDRATTSKTSLINNTMEISQDLFNCMVADNERETSPFAAELERLKKQGDKLKKRVDCFEKNQRKGVLTRDLLIEHNKGLAEWITASDKFHVSLCANPSAKPVPAEPTPPSPPAPLPTEVNE